MAKATSQEVDRMNRESNRLSRDQREPNRSRGASQGRHHRPRSLGATLNRGGHTSGSDGNRYHSNISSSGPDTDRNMGQKIFHKKITFFYYQTCYSLKIPSTPTLEGLKSVGERILSLTDTGENSKLVHRRKRPKVDTLF